MTVTSDVKDACAVSSHLETCNATRSPAQVAGADCVEFYGPKKQQETSAKTGKPPEAPKAPK
ncbi:uncharacterized protein N7500_005010 [Penicillium coprophilum]|uniref:uncharacterized protein n=1 Tax=Penicillium coprophilum TaxID=36646 RepID=UPI0023A55EFB|nr:uncharacterized protein N7500_005010 [Penicillium coprophilum]KAJ5163180.1 hypothetical protein N7500_005010 [Penicillium coprophilum]